MQKFNNKFKDLIFYEIYPTSFFDANNDGVGDLKGIKNKLGYIKELGFNAIWINPFYSSPFKDGGYDVKDFFAVDKKFGNMSDLDNLIKEGNKLGIKIIMDLVPGHMSEESEEFIKSGLEKRNEYSDLFIWNDCVWHMENGYRLISGRANRDGNYMINFFSTQPALNYGFNKIEYPSWQLSYKDKRTFKARELMIKVIKFYLKKGIAGFRVDMADSLVKNDEKKTATIEVWNDIFKRVRKEYPDAFFVSEWSNPSLSFKAGFNCDFVLDHFDNFYHHFARKNDTNSKGVAVINGGDPVHFIKNLTWFYNQAIKNNGYLGLISGNHDSPRIATFLPLNKLKMFYMFIFLMPGIPFIYYGDEIMMKNADVDNKDGGFARTKARTPMQWNNSINAGFSKAKTNKLYLPVNKGNRVNVKDAKEDKNSLFYTIKDLIRIRKTYPDITSKEMTFSVIDNVVTLNRKKIHLVLNCNKKKVITIKNKIIYSAGKKNILKPFEGAIYLK